MYNHSFANDVIPDIVLASTSTHVAPSFHILFVLGILLATIVFAHTVVRLFLFGGSGNNMLGSKRKIFLLPTSHSRTHYRRRHRHHGGGHRAMPPLSDDATDFVPGVPIQVQTGPEEEVQPDPHEARPTTTLFVPEPANGSDWKDTAEGLANPPPAYGKWRGSVRANPDLLHWQAVPSPVDAELPSPTYEEAVGESDQRTGPPSYVTRDSPARRRDVQEQHNARVQSQIVEPEMIEVRVGGVGTAM